MRLDIIKKYQNSHSINKLVSKLIAYKLGSFIILSIMFINASLFKWNLFVLGSMLFYLFLSRLRFPSISKIKFLNTVSLSIIYVGIFILLGQYNQSSLYIYFLGMTILSLYFSKDIIILYSASVIFFNIFGYFLFPEIYFLNHSISIWFYTGMFFIFNTILFSILIHYSKNILFSID